MKQLLILAFFYLFNSAGYSQSPTGIRGIPSPNASSLGLINEVPVSLYTGKCDISIPVYELKEGDISVPIYLNFNSSGVQPDVHPGWVGQNWSLQAGGLITRTVKGLPDETQTNQYIEGYNNGYPTVYYTHDSIGYIYNYKKNAESNWSDTSKIRNFALSPVWKDAEPDIFTFNINGTSGKFYLGEDGKFYCTSNPDIKIEIEDPVNISFPDYGYVYEEDDEWLLEKHTKLTNKKISGFLITMNDGFKYWFGYFGESVPAERNLIEYSVDFFDQIYWMENWNTWMLRKISSPNGYEVTFNYQYGIIPGSTAYNNYNNPIVSFHKTATYNKIATSEQPTFIERLLFPFSGKLTASTQNFSVNYSGEIIFPVYLSSIETNTQKLSFSISKTNELKYNFNNILANLQSQMASNYQKLLWSNTPRTILQYRTECIPLRPQDQGYPSSVYIPARNGFDYALLRTDLYNDDVSWLVDMYQNHVDIYSYLDNMVCEGKTPYYSTSEYGHIAPPLAEGIDTSRFRWFKLDSIKLYDKINSRYIKQWHFGYNNLLTERLMLLSLQEKGENNATKKPYTFEYEDYYGTSKYPGNYKLPGYNTDSLDHWGYFNNNYSQLETFDAVSMNGYYAKRNTNAAYLYTGQLNKINYPLGGSVEFTYEPNQYSTLIKRNQTSGAFEREDYSTPITGGGLRIKNIKYKDGELVKSEKNYLYSGGILGQEIKYYWDNYQGTLESNGSTTYSAERFVSENLLPGCGGLDYTVSYQKAEEKISGIGRTEYYYSNHLTNPDENFIATIDNYKSISSPFSSKDCERGKLLRKIIKDENGTIKKIENYKYVKNNEVTKDYVPAIASWRFKVLANGWSIEGASYKNYIYPYNLSEQVDSIYDTNGNYLTKSVVKYQFNTNNLLKCDHTINSNNDTIKNTYKYPLNLSNTNPYDEMISFNILSPVIEQYKYKNSILLSGVLNDYMNTGAGLYAPRKVSQQKGSFPKEDRIIFNRYDYRGHPIYMIKDSVEKVVNIWSYNYQYPIIEVKGATITEVMEALNIDEYVYLESMSAQSNPNISNIDALLRSYFSSKNAQVTTYTYKPLVGMTSMTDPRGVTTYYDYDSFGRLKTIKDNANYILKEYTYHYKEDNSLFNPLVSVSNNIYTGLLTYSANVNASFGGTNVYYWDFGDGTTLSTPSGSHSYLHPGTYIVTCIINNSVHGTKNYSFQMDFPQMTINPSISLNNYQDDPSIIYFNIGTGNFPCSYAIDFGNFDGYLTTGSSGVIFNDDLGTSTLTITATNPFHGTGTTTKTITLRNTHAYFDMVPHNGIELWDAKLDSIDINSIPTEKIHWYETEKHSNSPNIYNIIEGPEYFTRPREGDCYEIEAYCIIEYGGVIYKTRTYGY